MGRRRAVALVLRLATGANRSGEGPTVGPEPRRARGRLARAADNASYLVLLKLCAEAAKVRLVDAQNGPVEVYAMAHDVFGLLRFAEQVRGMAIEFDALKAKIEPG